ncbi:MAG: peptide-N-glycosidase F-related protein [Pseudomonadota bacterium]
MMPGKSLPVPTVTDQLTEQSVTIPAGISRAEVRAVVTGHGQGNQSNCAEFCHLNQVVGVNGTEFSFDPWRYDCDENPIGPLQAGTWTYERAGWCPGAYVLPHVFDITEALSPGAENTFTYGILTRTLRVYENTCRPGAGDEDNTCVGCVFNDNPGNCDYDGGMHTQPGDRVSVQLLLYN